MIVEITKLPLGWLSTSGDFIECDRCDHIFYAEEILKRICPVSYTYYNSRPDDGLLELGYVKISLSIVGRKEYLIYWNRHLTDSQKEFLIPYFESDMISFNSKARWEYECDSRNVEE